MTTTATAAVLPETPSPTEAANENARAGGREAWYRNYHRYCDPATGRYTQVDPLVADGVSREPAYAYVLNNPITNTDPKGLVTYKGCDRQQRQLISLAIYYARLRAPACRGGQCGNRRVDEILKWFNSPMNTITCGAQDVTIDGVPRCGLDPKGKGSANNIWLDPAGIREQRPHCKCLPGLVVHEAAHAATGWSHPDGVDAYNPTDWVYKLDACLCAGPWR